MKLKKLKKKNSTQTSAENRKQWSYCDLALHFGFRVRSKTTPKRSHISLPNFIAKKLQTL